MTRGNKVRVACLVALAVATVVFVLLTTACAHSLTVPTLSANAGRAALDVAAPVVRAECVEERALRDRACVASLRSARTREAVTAAETACDARRADLDELCDPLVRAYRTVRLAHAALVAAIAAASSRSDDDPTEVIARAAALASAVQKLGGILNERGQR